MKSLALVIFASLVAIGLWLAPTSFAARDSDGIRSDEGAYRMRLCELALFSGESVQRDRMLEPRAGQDVPYGPFAPAASAFVLARALPQETFDLEHGALDEDALANGAARLWSILAWCGCISLALAARKFARSDADAAEPRDWSVMAAWITALAWTMLALAPSSDGGSVRAPVWGLIFGAFNLWGAALLARPRELMDQLGIAIGVGAVTGVALLNDPFVWPALLAPAVGLWISVRGARKSARRDALRCALFFIASSLAVFGLRSTWPGGASPWPRFDPAWQTRSGALADPCIFGASVLLAAWLVLTSRANSARRALCVVLVASVVVRAIDPRFAAAPLAPAGCAFVAWTTSMWRAPSARALRRALSTGVVALLGAVALSSDGAQYSTDAISALRELRDTTVSSGAWNHPAAPQPYAILATPRAAGAIVFHARRPVSGALLPGADVTDAARVAADTLLSGSCEELLARANELNAPYVLVTQRDRDRFDDLWSIAGRPMDHAGQPRTADGYPAQPDGALLELLTADQLPGFELLRRVPAVLGSGGLAELAIWRVVAPIHEPPAAMMRAR